MSRYFYFIVFVCFFTSSIQKVFGMEDENYSHDKKNLFKKTKVAETEEANIGSQPAGIYKTPDGKTRIIYGYSYGQYICGDEEFSTLEEALASLPAHPVYKSFAALYLALEERITSLQKDGQAFEERWKSKDGKESNVLTLFCEDFDLDINHVTQKFGIKKLKESARKYLAGHTKMHKDYQGNVINNLRDAQQFLNLDLLDVVGKYPQGPDIPTFMQFQAHSYQQNLEIFIEELNGFSQSILNLKNILNLDVQLLNEDSLKFTSFYRYRIGNLILQYKLLRLIKDSVTPFLEFFPDQTRDFFSLPERNFDQLLSNNLFAQQPDLVKSEKKGKKARNRRQVNKSNKVKNPKKENVTDETCLALVRGLSLHQVIKAPDSEEAFSFLSEPPLPPGGYKTQYRKGEESTKVKTHKAADEKEKEKGIKSESDNEIFKESRFSQAIFYAENPDVLRRLIRGEKVELNEYLNLITDLVLSNPAIFEKVEFTGQHGTHPVFRLSFRNGMSYSWEISQAHGGRFIPQNHNYRKSYRKPFKFLGILETGLKDIQEKKCEVEKDCHLQMKSEGKEKCEPEKKVEKQTIVQTKKKRKRNRKKKGNNTLSNPSPNLEKEGPGAGSAQHN